MRTEQPSWYSIAVIGIIVLTMTACVSPTRKQLPAPPQASSDPWTRALTNLPIDLVANPVFASAPPPQITSLVQRITRQSFKGNPPPDETVEQVRIIAKQGGLVLVQVTRFTNGYMDMTQSKQRTGPPRLEREEFIEARVLNGLIGTAASGTFAETLKSMDMMFGDDEKTSAEGAFEKKMGYASYMLPGNAFVTNVEALSALQGGLYPLQPGKTLSFQYTTAKQTDKAYYMLDDDGTLKKNTLDGRSEPVSTNRVFMMVEPNNPNLNTAWNVSELPGPFQVLRVVHVTTFTPADVFDSAEPPTPTIEFCQNLYSEALQWVVAEKCTGKRTPTAEQVKGNNLEFKYDLWNKGVAPSDPRSGIAHTSAVIGYGRDGKVVGQSFAQVSQKSQAEFTNWKMKKQAEVGALRTRSARLLAAKQAEIDQREAEAEARREATFSTMLGAMTTSMNIAVQGVQQYQAAKQGIPPTVNIVPGRGMGEAGAGEGPSGGAATGSEAYGAGAGLGAPGTGGVGGGTGCSWDALDFRIETKEAARARAIQHWRAQLARCPNDEGLKRSLERALNEGQRQATLESRVCSDAWKDARLEQAQKTCGAPETNRGYGKCWSEIYTAPVESCRRGRTQGPAGASK